MESGEREACVDEGVWQDLLEVGFRDHKRVDLDLPVLGQAGGVGVDGGC